jgi:hypothetical protein
MAPMRGSVARSWLRRSSAWLVFTALWSVARSAPASQSVVVHAEGAELEPLVGRLCAELSTAGYAISLVSSDPPVACQHGETAWITLAPSSTDSAAVVATLCVDGTQVTVGGPRADPARLAIGTAEALNGLGAAAPPSPPWRSNVTTEPASESPLRLRIPHAVSAGQMLLVGPGGFPPLWGTSMDVELGLTAHTALVLGGFFPVARAKLATSAGEVRAGVALLRVGVALRYSLASFAVTGSLVVGPAYTWVTAKAFSPYVGSPDFAFGVAGGAGLSVGYPSRSRVFAVAGSRAGVLLPSPRFKLPNESPRDLGPLLLEASLGIGLRL